ncbi:hypothetical protein EMCRGX_G026921 [Ephydatia muelleri]
MSREEGTLSLSRDNEAVPLVSPFGGPYLNLDEPTPTPVVKKNNYDSLDYDICYNVPYKRMLRGYTKYTYWHTAVMRWVVVGVIGFLTGLVAFLLDLGMRNLLRLKFSVFSRVLDSTLPQGTMVYSFLVLLAFNVGFALLSAIVTAIEPISGGSGVPEIKCYLNGVKVPRVARIGGLVSKAVGVLLSVSAGFFVGQEGPMVYIGSVIGAGLPQLRSLLPCVKKFSIPYPYFRQDREKRDFVSSGAAAGVASAFGAPIGGTLFSLEEGSSFWNQGLTWRTLFCSFCATFTFNLLLSASTSQGFIDRPGQVDFGTFENDLKDWRYYHLIIFALMGAGGGLLGALFNSLNKCITMHRMAHVRKRKLSREFWSVLEAILVISATTLLVFICAAAFSTCISHDHDVIVMSNSSEYESERNSYFCPAVDDHGTVGDYHNDVSTILFNSQEVATQLLFHLKNAFTLNSLWIVFVLYFLVSCWTLGTPVSSGLFIPCIVTGALYGRLVGTFFETYNVPLLSPLFGEVYPGIYALIGSASFLSGVMRMTLSLTVIMIEATQQVTFGVPIMVSVVVAKWVGDIFTAGIYDINIQLKKIPYMEWDSPEHMDRLSAEDIMSKDIKYLPLISKVETIDTILRTTTHSAFPVTEDNASSPGPKVPLLYRSKRLISEGEEEETAFESSMYRYQKKGLPQGPSGNIQGSLATRRAGKMAEGEDQEGQKELVLHGMILRTQLVTLLKNNLFIDENEQADPRTILTHDQMMQEYPRFSENLKRELTDEEKAKYIDLSPYMNPCPYLITSNSPLPQVFTLFRTMGLRHLPVIKATGNFVGIITRHDLTHDNLHRVRKHHKLSAARVSAVDSSA